MPQIQQRVRAATKGFPRTWSSSRACSFAPEHWLEEHGDALYAYAYMRLRDRCAAEDVIQETLLSAWRARHSFAGNSSERTWLVGILKHRLVDYWRKTRRQIPTGEVFQERDSLDDVFDETGNWRNVPSQWAKPDEALELQEFLRVFLRCVAALPRMQARVFTLCEIEGLSGDEVCQILSIGLPNLWVALHRARTRLRQELEERWFAHARLPVTCESRSRITQAPGLVR